LYSITRDGSFVPFKINLLSDFFHRFHLVLGENLVDGGERERNIVKPEEFALNPSSSQIARVPEFENQTFIMVGYFSVRGAVRTPAQTV
jgi:hypothetical protein